jgi:DnaK suppressor protein
MADVGSGLRWLPTQARAFVVVVAIALALHLESKLMSNMQSGRAQPNQALVDALRTELDRAQEHLDRLAAEYDGLLGDNDAIQEDRDSAGQLVADARSAVSRAEKALARAESGGYGLCINCGAEIPAERLEALPDADRCVACS